MSCVGADRRADVEHDRFAAQRRPQGRDGGAIDRGHCVQAKFGHRHQRAGVAGGNGAIGRAALDRLDRLPHRRDPPPSAQRLAGLVSHLDRDIGMKNARLGGQSRMSGENRTDHLLIPVKQEPNVRPALQRDRGARHDDGRTVIAPHRVKRYANVARHSLVRPPPKRLAPAAPGAARQ